jgi:hypothetical protein
VTALRRFHQDRAWIAFRRLFDEQSRFVLLVWLSFAVVVAAFIVGISFVRPITRSIWEPASRLAPWYAFFIGIYLGNNALPLHVAYSRTRRECAREGAAFIALFGAVLAVLICAGFFLESVLYRIAGWPQNITGDHLFTSAGQIPLIFTEFWLRFLTWLAGGAMIAAAWYRFDATGLLTIGPAFAALGATERALGTTVGPLGSLFESFIGEGTRPPLALTIAISIGSFVMLLAVTWPIVRDIPIRTQRSQ